MWTFQQPPPPLFVHVIFERSLTVTMISKVLIILFLILNAALVFASILFPSENFYSNQTQSVGKIGFDEWLNFQQLS